MADIRNLDKEVELDVDKLTDKDLQDNDEVEGKDEINKEEEIEVKVEDLEEKEESEEEVQEEKEEKEEKEKEEENEEEIDYKEKFIASQKEALRIREENLKLLKDKEKIISKPKVTDKELQEKYSDWEYYSENEQKLIRKTEEQERRLVALEAMNQSYLNEKKYSKDVDDQIGLWDATGEFKAVIKNKQDFKRFAKKDGNKGLPMDVLARLFLYELPKKAQPKGSTPMSISNVKHTDETENSQMTIEDVSLLRKTKPMEYMKRAANGEFDNIF